MIKDIIVLGSGTSGLVTALSIKSMHPNKSVRVLYSSKHPIIGVGEGSTEHWTNFMKLVGITPQEVFKETGATFKMGLAFENWNGDGKVYLHSIDNDVALEDNLGVNLSFIQAISEGMDPNDLVSPFILKNTHLADNIETLQSHCYQYHFHTFKLNDFLVRKCKEKNIELVDCEIDNVCLDEHGYVSHLTDVGGNNHSADFFFDCSGFSRIISNKLGNKWIDYSHYLPVNRAIAFPTPNTGEYNSYSLATAKDYGWIWRTPTQERYGNGYVFHNDYITADKAKEEVDKHFGFNVDIFKDIKFSAGHTEKYLLKNCSVIGLSSSFVEPLEASSISTTIQQAYTMGMFIDSWEKHNHAKLEEIYNDTFNKFFDNIVDFIQLHYLVKREDTPFWKDIKNGSIMKLTDFNRETLPIFKRTLPKMMFFPDIKLLFRATSWTQIMFGLDMFDKHAVREYRDHCLTNYVIEEVKQYLDKYKSVYNNRGLLSHSSSILALRCTNSVTNYLGIK